MSSAPHSGHSPVMRRRRWNERPTEWLPRPNRLRPKPKPGGKDLAETDAAAGRRFDDIRSSRSAEEGTEGVSETLPEFTDVEIDSTKITGYAMNPDHPVGRNKYRVIHSATGLDAGNAAGIEQQIREGARAGAPIKGTADQYGQRWAVDVPLAGSGGSIKVRTAWILDVGSTTPRLVTISFPKEGK
ncbi:DUF6883 domain-containing protein [Actinoplanes sp. NPDC051411]|uniref:DUF6883 domain-containing protein n=1 Tax=Actinoplanes sp. NPDC051411 TaxID=3155522 RepID=UPI003421DCDA